MTPPNYLDPAWDTPDSHYDWRNYVVTDLAIRWLDMSDEHRQEVAKLAQRIADIAKGYP
jgi:hypothetical protein